MPLESATYISQLDETKPSGSDSKAEGDDVLKLIKAVVKNTFPNATGPITVTPAEMNALSGVTSTGATLKVVTQSQADNSLNAASTAYVDAGLAAVAASGLPSQTGNDGKTLETDGTTASWGVAGITAHLAAFSLGVI